METITVDLNVSSRSVAAFPDYFKSELMETGSSSASWGRVSSALSRLLQIGINGNFEEIVNPLSAFVYLSRLLQIGINGNELSKGLKDLLGFESFPITSNRN